MNIWSARYRITIKLSAVVCSMHLIVLCFPTGAQELTSARRGAAHIRRLSDTKERIVFDSSFMAGPRTAAPHWDGSYLISHEIETFSPEVPNVSLYDKLGRKVRSSAVWFEGSQRVLVTAATVTSDGKIVASGIAEKKDGTAAPFIVLTDLSGSVTDVVRTDGFYPSSICVAPDNTVWSFGGTGYDEARGEANPGDILRHFDFKKGQMGGFIPRSTYPRHPMPDERAFIRCSANQAVVYAAQELEFIEIDYDGRASPQRYRAEAPSGLKLDGFAFQGPKMVFGYFSNHLNIGDRSQGLYTLSFDEAAKTVRWIPVDGAVGAGSQPGVVRALWGADGDELVVSRAGDPAGSVAIHWATPVVQ